MLILQDISGMATLQVGECVASVSGATKQSFVIKQQQHTKQKIHSGISTGSCLFSYKPLFCTDTLP